MENRFERPADEHLVLARLPRQRRQRKRRRLRSRLLRASLWTSISMVAGLILLQGVADVERWSLARTAYHTTGGGGGGSSSGGGASAAGSASLGGSAGASAGP